MDKNVDLVKKYNLEEAVKRIQNINEYTFYSPTMVEDEQDPNADDNGQAPPMNGTQGGDPNAMGGDMPQGYPNGGMPQQDMGNQMTPMDGGQGGDPNAMDGDMPQGASMDGGDMNMEDTNAMSGEEMPPMGGDEGIEDVEMDTEQPDDEVIDVDELTQSQETTEFKVDNVDDKLNKVLKVISKFNDAIEANDQKIEDLKKEFAKRNPTPEETLNLRSLSSTPFSEKPDEYWKKQQELHPNYNVISDNDVSTADEQKEFEIRKGDIDNFNERDVLKSLGEGHIKLSDFLDF
jgi:hypothetical protein